MPEWVTDRSDPRVLDFARLTDVEYRRAAEPAAGLFLAEGAVVIGRALAAGYRPRRVLATESRWSALAPDLAAVGAAPEVLLADEPTLQAITGYPVHRGALASFERRPLPGITDVAAAADLVLVLEGLVDPTNVGAAVRSAAAFGIDAVVLDPRCADPLYRRAVKVSMGATLVVPHARAERWPADLELLRESGLRLVALSPAGPVALADALEPGGRHALLLGSEGPGLSRHAQGAADVVAAIPMSGAVDSLNVAAAAAVACYEATRHRRG